MYKFRSSLKVQKLLSSTDAIVSDNIVNKTWDTPRDVGIDTRDFIISNSDGIRDIPVGEFANESLIYLESVWAETDTTDPNNSIIENEPAPIELRFNVSAPWIRAERLMLAGSVLLNQLQVRNPNISGKKVRVIYTIGAKN